MTESHVELKDILAQYRNSIIDLQRDVAELKEHTKGLDVWSSEVGKVCFLALADILDNSDDLDDEMIGTLRASQAIVSPEMFVDVYGKSRYDDIIAVFDEYSEK